MIYKAAEYKNGYMFTNTSIDEEFQKIVSEHGNVKCIICNENTVRNFKREHHIHYGIGITINKKLADGAFFINGIY